jgi:DNA helicase II / ATP-dependent DNA helicase PcrA
MSSFAQEYDRLNPAQKKAVDTIEGPVMVIAGPGTGKTQVLSLRVANILEKAQVNPRSILCLTYTTSGATAMRERLRELIGAPAYAITINTIHGFCNDVIAQHPHVFEQWAALEQISDIEQIRAVNKIIDDLLPDLELVNRKSPYMRTRDIIGRISQIKREGLTLADLESAADEHESILTGKSKEGTKAHEKNVASARKFRDFVKIFEKYQEMLRETQRYDYDDMILHVLDAFGKEDWMLQNIQERYLYILVDEFQDTNGAQYKVIEDLVTPRTSEDFPNLFIVGDDDQAIYRFQGANIKNLLSFHTRFPKAPVVVLTTSYRCSQPILDAAGRLIAHNTERLVGVIKGLTKDLVSANKKTAPDPLLYRSPSDAVEPWMIADLVDEELKAGTQPSEIAILTQTNSELRPIYDVLQARGIPVQMDGKVDLLRHPLVRQAVSILQAVRNPESNPAFSAGLSAACNGCHPADLGRLFYLAREKQKPIIALMLDLDDPSSDASLLPWHDKQCLITKRDLLLSLNQQLPNRTLVDTLETILRECNLLPDASSGRTFDPVDFAALQAFFEYIKFRSYEQTTFGFETLLSDINLYANGEYNLRLSYTIPHLTQEGVQLLTAHQSKGLEYEAVILANFKDGHWDKRRNPPSVSIPEDLLFGWDSDQKTIEQHQDERRVAYVAMTRAKRKLIFSCPLEITTGTKARDISPSGFFVEAGPLPEEKRGINDPSKVSTLLFTPMVSFDAAYEAFLRERLKDFRLSVTALNHFLNDPKEFLEKDLLQTPDVKTESLVYGNAVHAALRKWGMSAQEGHPISAEHFLSEFANYLSDREILTEAQRRNLIAQGERDLPRYYEQRLLSTLPFVYRVEFPINTYLSDGIKAKGKKVINPDSPGIPIKGKIDRIDLERPDSARATIIDFKTGRPKSEGQIRDEADYFRQLVFYAILMEYGMPTYEPTGYVLDFIGEGTEHPIQRAFVISDGEKKELEEVIKAVWMKIQNLDFTPLS